MGVGEQIWIYIKKSIIHVLLHLFQMYSRVCIFDALLGRLLAFQHLSGAVVRLASVHVRTRLIWGSSSKYLVYLLSCQFQSLSFSFIGRSSGKPSRVIISLRQGVPRAGVRGRACAQLK